MKIKMEILLNSDVRLLARASSCVVLVFCCHLALHRATQVFPNACHSSLFVSVDDDPGGAAVWPSAA